MAMTMPTGNAVAALNGRAVAKELGWTGFVVLALAFSLVGFEVLDSSGGPKFNLRFADVGATVVLTVLGRLAQIMLREHRARLVALTAIPFSLAMLALLSTGTWTYVLPFSSAMVGWLVSAIAMIFGVRGLVAMSHGGIEASAEQREGTMDKVGAGVQRAARYLGPLILAFAILLPFMPFADRRIVDIGILVATYVMLGWGLNIVVGLAGLLDLGYVAFYAVGSYSFALLASHFGLSFWYCLPFAGLMSALFGVLLGFPVLRLRGDYLAIVTLGFGEIVRIILLNWWQFTGGPDGLSGIPRPSFFGLPFSRRVPEGSESFSSFFGLEYSTLHRVIFLYYLIIALALITNLFTIRIRKLPVGRAWEALREDEIACRSLGINPRNTKLTAFGIGAMFAGFAGSFFATRQGFISPESFTFIESAIILAIVVLGGMGSQVGVVLAAIVLIGLPEMFRDLQQYRMLAFGSAMVLIMIWRPSGLLAHREPTISLKRGGSG